MRIGVSSAMFLATVVLIGSLTGYTSGGQPPKKETKKGGQPFGNLIADLKASPGCLGVEVARTESGKQVIFAWFEDKKALLKWYHSDTHRALMKDFFPDQKYGQPLKDVPETGPIMTIASITFAEKGQVKETSLPISQIAIELYQPAPGGVFYGGRFAPAGVKVPGIKDAAAKDKK
jgi:hypothetical protein